MTVKETGEAPAETAAASINRASLSECKSETELGRREGEQLWAGWSESQIAMDALQHKIVNWLRTLRDTFLLSLNYTVHKCDLSR